MHHAFAGTRTIMVASHARLRTRCATLCLEMIRCCVQCPWWDVIIPALLSLKDSLEHLDLSALV